MNVPVLSVAFDPASEQSQAALENGIQNIPLLVDADHSVSEAYGVLEWAVGTGEPGHTFILVGADGKIAWIQDYGAPENRGVMYVPVDELTHEVSVHLEN